MSRLAVLLPVFVQAGLMFTLLFWLAGTRYSALKAGAADLATYRDTGNGWPRNATLIGNCYKNQFELPLLFFALVPLALITEKADFLFVVLSWVFVLSRLVHALIYTTTNELRRRSAVFTVGAIALFAMWVMFALNITVSSL
ncbi:MAPEG family protein [Terrihabitans sp. B22-R8]|uniref:MAPEG family protein n=1 Tax=Terrihabitans sp. B22-R8 TaxID=3425128 RepID=UPI00403C5B6C